MTLLKIGNRVRILEPHHPVENYEVDVQGKLGMITKVHYDELGESFESVYIKLDEPLTGLEHYDNELQYQKDCYPNLEQFLFHSLELVSLDIAPKKLLTELKKFTHHVIIQSPVEPLATYELVITGPDQSEGQAGLTEAVQRAFEDFSGHKSGYVEFSGDHLCYVAFHVHPDGSPAWEACEHCNRLCQLPNDRETQIQYYFTDTENGVEVFHNDTNRKVN